MQVGGEFSRANCPDTVQTRGALNCCKTPPSLVKATVGKNHNRLMKEVNETQERTTHCTKRSFYAEQINERQEWIKHSNGTLQPIAGYILIYCRRLRLILLQEKWLPIWNHWNTKMDNTVVMINIVTVYKNHENTSFFHPLWQTNMRLLKHKNGKHSNVSNAASAVPQWSWLT